jgi:hypothetical protein
MGRNGWEPDRSQLPLEPIGFLEFDAELHGMLTCETCPAGTRQNWPGIFWNVRENF